jgi:hypothetical protein
MPAEKTTQFTQRFLDPLEVRYAFGYARMMNTAKLSMDGPQLITERLTDDLDQIVHQLFKAYVASAIRGRPVGFFLDKDRQIRWDLMHSQTFFSVEKSFDRVSFKAFEDLPSWRSAAYYPYKRIIEDLPNLLTRLELIEIEDSSLRLVTSDEDFKLQAEKKVELFQSSLRNDGFLVHGPGMKVTVHHRQAGEIVKGVDVLRDHLLASTDYTEQRLFNKRSVGGGLAGVDQADREFEQSQVMARLNECWTPVIALWIRAMGYDPKSVTMNWIVGTDDRLKNAQIEKLVAETAEKNITSGVLPESAYTARFLGGETPSEFPVVDPSVTIDVEPNGPPIANEHA